ncbi:hypothetical protein K9U40_13100 [Xanthobacter autotrophicus]|uniref:spike base protein, RCAP_Rcc01079 family n=1 Tax=Xanthobacter TaxID=279 RepID=UPI0024AB22ED|nr:hypothetical protein [Xanthobacter autotrophicus]MDI4665260.1 hypothetical protein [Xanthobacter autotrophicus]
MPYDSTRDPLKGFASSLSSPARQLVRITPADGADLATYAKALWVFVPEDVAGGVATIRITPVAGGDADTVDVLALPGLQPLPPCQVRRVWATGTSAGLAVYALCDR